MQMRFLGNKDSILTKIEQLLGEKGLLNDEYTFFDAFCGTGAVAEYFKNRYRLIINDNLNWATIYTKGRICAPLCKFEKLGFDPFSYLNNSKSVKHGFIYNTYSVGGSTRMYFTAENAERIDYFRAEIEEWKKGDLLSDAEYCYLLACLIESVSHVSNTAGVYGAFLKKWDSRALKPIVFNKVDFVDTPCKSVDCYCNKIENIISKIDCDILYLDPPYTQNQYGTQYHLLETLILDDNPSVSAITGSRPTAPMRSDWSKEFKANILFDKVLAETRAKYIILSYNNDGFMSKEFIESAMKRYGKPETFVCKKISYKKYQNWKSQNENAHFEYLFFIEKKDLDEVNYESPLNYIGNKSRVVSEIKRFLPENISTFMDIFGGGFNVGINIAADNVIFNDYNFFVTELVESFKKYPTYEYLLTIHKYIKKFGLEKANAEAYVKARAYYNQLPKEKKDPRLLFTIILYGYQQQIRFNSSHEFNNPVGMRWFNDCVLEKMISFSRRIKERDCIFKSCNYLDLFDEIGTSTFVYLDPPYQLTTGSYNDGKRGFYGWSQSCEKKMFSFLESLSNRGVKFMLSYVVEHKGTENEKIKEWITKNNYHVIPLGDILGISGSRRKEVLILNYEVL